jgi:hypothetical protein
MQAFSYDGLRYTAGEFPQAYSMGMGRRGRRQGDVKPWIQEDHGQQSLEADVCICTCVLAQAGELLCCTQIPKVG